MSAEGAGRREFTQLVANHVLGDVDSSELFAVVDIESESDELWSDRGAPRPSLDRLFGTAVGVGLLDFLDQVIVDEEAFFDGTCHEEKSG